MPAGANFALSAGLVREDELLPQQDMTREDVALVLYRFALTLGAEALTDTGALMAYPDGGELSGEGLPPWPGPWSRASWPDSQTGGWTPRGRHPGSCPSCWPTFSTPDEKEDAVG